LQEEKSFKGFWRMSFDGACSGFGSGVGILFKDPNATIHLHAMILEFPYTNNEV
jgi:hypothetical protein